MLESCLPATGPEGWVIALLVAVGVVLLVAGAIFLARSKARMAMLMVPVAALALVLAAPAQPSQAVDAAIPGFTVGNADPEGAYTDWFETGDDVWVQDALLTPEQANALIELFGLDADPTLSGITFRLLEAPFSTDGTDSTGVVLDEDGLPEVPDDLVDDGTDGFQSLFPIEMTLTATFEYADSCNRPQQTVITYTGLLAFVA